MEPILKEIRSLLEPYHLPERALSFGLLLLIFAVGATGLCYTENFFGFGNWVRKLFRAVRKEEAAPEELPKQTIKETPTVGFENERKPRRIELLKAVNSISKAQFPGSIYRVPLEFDGRVAAAVIEMKDVEKNFESVMRQAGTEPSAQDLSDIHNACEFVDGAIKDLPALVGLMIVRLKQEDLSLDALKVAEICSRTIELGIAEVIRKLSQYRVNKYHAEIFKDYVGRDPLVGIIDGRSQTEYFSYRLRFVGDQSEIVVLAPTEYRDQFIRNTSGCIPPFAFITKYAFPQLLWSQRDKPDAWNLSLRCQSVFVKDLDDNYLS